MSYGETGHEVALTDAELDELKTNLKAAGLGDIAVTTNGFVSIIENSGVSFRAFGGLSVNLTVIRIDLTGMYNLTDQNWGISLGTRFQL
jgi:hypothetical protein